MIILEDVSTINITNFTSTAFLIPINLLLTTLILIPLRPIKAPPLQHFLNLLSPLFLPPSYPVPQAFISSVLPISFPTPTPFPFPPTIIRVLLSTL
ncbi:energy coupling factor transporter S component ThiW, partial [Staphylococcus epidermidis]|uniref:energy coupling factor transporter S component ThiW n=1 Tax=Staphylococcus epidermidis TaxID=1282 RepID=UPI00164323CE